MEFRRGIDKLRPDMTIHAIVFHATLEELGVRNFPLPFVSPDFFPKLWGDNKPTKRIKTWGHDHGRLSAHWISTRGGTPMHVDPGYSRYAVQIQLYNEGFLVHGLEDDLAKMPLFTPGLVTILDTHSPHQVSRDPRLPNIGNSKLAAAIDFVGMPNVRTVLPELLAKVKRWSNEVSHKRAA